jgi:glycosyltransferase involved in cell wall biosynthesis
VSEKVREFCIQEDHLSPNKVVTVSNGVDLESVDVQPSPDRKVVLGLSDDVPVIMTVANLRPIKGIDLLVRTAALVCKQFPTANFVVVGETHKDSYLQELRTLAQQLGIQQNIRFLGRRNDVYALLKSSDLFCLPSRSEGMSNALLEAMACRLPCVATNVGGNSEVIIDGETGFLVSPENPQPLADGIIALLKDRERAQRIGEAGRRVVESKFTVQHMVQRLSSLYEGLLQERGLHSVRCSGQYFKGLPGVHV